MELKRCSRCGKFFTSDLAVCQDCTAKDNLDVAKLRGYIEENGLSTISTVEQLSLSTGIAQKNLTRYLEYSEFEGVASMTAKALTPDVIDDSNITTSL